MKKTNFKKLLSLIVCIVLVAAIALMLSGCKDNNKTDDTSSGITNTDPLQKTVFLGEGETKFDFTVIHKDGSTKSFEISTDKETVGEALAELGIVEGDESEYGLFVTAVDGEKLEYDSDGMWWEFDIDGEMAMSGVDQTPIEHGKEYSFKAAKA